LCVQLLIKSQSFWQNVDGIYWQLPKIDCREKLLADACTTETMRSFAELLLFLFFNFILAILIYFKKFTFNEHCLIW
jgi:hypothetical protein